MQIIMRHALPMEWGITLTSEAVAMAAQFESARALYFILSLAKASHFVTVSSRHFLPSNEIEVSDDYQLGSRSV